MSGKTFMVALAVAFGALVSATGVQAADGNVAIFYGTAVSAAPQVTEDERGTGIDVHRGPQQPVLRKPAEQPPTTTISRRQFNLDNLEPTANWFVDRSEGRLRIVHCYARSSIYVNRPRRIRCSARDY